MQRRLLLIEDCDDDRLGLAAELTARTGAVCRRAHWDDLPSALPDQEVDLVVAVAGAATAGAVAVFEALQSRPLGTPLVALLPIDADEPLLRVVLQTADDFVFRSPACVAELCFRLERMLTDARCHAREARRRLLEEAGCTRLVGQDAAFVQAIGQVPRFAQAEAPVLITGETGTGKELCARAIHQASRRRRFPFVAVDCGSIPAALFESEMFGHVRGAFTDAHRDHRGLVAMAEGGTLFLDEVDALPLAAQAKLLRVIQERTLRAVGSERFVRADVKIVAATNRDLEACVQAREFRADLYFRLNVLRLELPALRQRKGDIELLAYSLLEEQRSAAGAGPRAFSPAALRQLVLHDWPGNVRELSNVVQRAMVACDGDTIRARDVGLADDLPSDAAADGFRSARAAAMAAFERQYIRDLLRKHGGNVTHAAREARQDRRAFGRFIKKHRIDRQTP